MAYSTNPHLPKARAAALRLLLEEGLPVSTVALRAGVHRTTIWRWKQKWLELNKNIQLDNPNRPRRPVSRRSKLSACRWQIATLRPVPHTSPGAICEQVIRRVLEVRQSLKRCAEVVWHYLTHRDGIQISLSSVRRILRRHHCFDGARKPRVRRDNPRRPHITRPGELVQTDTIHHVDPGSGRKLYYYTVIDLYTRLSYVTMATTLRQGRAARAVLEAQAAMGIRHCHGASRQRARVQTVLRGANEAGWSERSPQSTAPPQRQCSR
jgi:transposase-like protein